MRLTEIAKDLSIKNKLIAIILLVVVAAMVLMMSFTLVEKINKAETDLANNTILNANLIGEYCVTALYFQRPDAAADALNKLESISYILNAKVYGIDSSVFAEYNREKFKINFIKEFPDSTMNSFFEDDYLVVSVPLTYLGQNLGTLYLRSSLNSLKSEIRGFIIFNLILFIVILTGSYFFASRLQILVSKPILHLAEVTKEITRNKNFDLRVEKHGKDEIGNLYDEFNYMLERIKVSSEERNHALETLGISEERLKFALEGSNDGLWVWDLTTNQVYFSPRWQTMLGYEYGEVEGNFDEWEKMVHPEDVKEVEKIIFEHIEGKSENYKSEFRMKTKNGNWIWILDRGKVVQHDKNGKPLRMVGTHTDISERKKIEEELLHAKEKAEKSDKFKSEFLAQMSHEIRSPINVILNFVSLLKDELNNKIDPELANSFDYIDSGGRRIIRTIDMILNMSEIQTGIYELNPTPHHLTEDIIRNLIMEYKTQAKIKGLELILNNSLEKNHFIKVDEYSVSQIFSNLIDNAIKYTYQGNINVNVYSDDYKNIIAEVEDTGIGISKEYIPNLFDAFTQEESGYSRKFEGNGLGLALVKRYCELNDAHISVESEKGKGTKFTVKFSAI